MKKSRLVHIFSTLSKKEIRDLRKWLHSPAHNQRADSVALFEYLVKESRSEEPEKLDKVKIFPHVFPDLAVYEDDKMRQVMYFLLKSTEEFLVYDEFKKNKTQHDITLARVLGNRRLDKYFQKAINDIQGQHQKSTLRDKEYYRTNYEIKYEKYEYLSKINRMVDFNLQDISDSLDVYFLCLKLRQCCIMESHRKVFKTEYDIGLLRPILEHVQEKKLMEIPAVGIYYYGFLSIAEEGDDKNFEKFQSVLFANEAIFPKEELGELYLIAINNSIKKINKGDMSFLHNAFELYKRGFENEILLLENRITVFTFNNVVLIALRIKEFTWAEDFIENYNQFLKPDNRASTVLYCKARLSFAKGDFDTAMDLFRQVEHNDILLNLTAKTFLLKMYYEQNESKVLESLLDSMRAYVRRKEVVGYHKENYRNIIKYTKKLVRLNPYSISDRIRLQAEIEQANPLTEKKWLLEQLKKV